MKRVLLTGGAGFIGHHIAEHILKNTDYEIVFLDRLDCSGNMNRIAEIDNWSEFRKRCRWIYHDIKAEFNSLIRSQIGKVDIILHLAAGTHVRNVADAVLFILKNGEHGEKYNIVGEKEVSNLDLAKKIAEIQGKKLNYEMVDFHSSRPGHDLRYALCGEKMRLMGWVPPVSFEDSMRRVVEWTLSHADMWLVK